jgi:tRNA 2-thiouridine synthesizing protein A
MGFSDDEPVIVMNREFSQEMVFKPGMAVFMEEIIPDAELDCVGLFCPMPIALTKEEIEKLQPGQVLMVEADDPAAEEDIKRWAERTGHELLRFEKEEGILTFYIRKKQ